MSRTLYLDCFAGVAGDMILGALLDAGLPFDQLRDALGGLADTPGLVALDRVRKSGIVAAKFRVHTERAGSVGHRHSHASGHQVAHPEPQGGPSSSTSPEGHHHHGHRTLAEIEHLVDHSGLSVAARRRTLALFRRLAEVEAAVHDMPVDQVLLHEVGSIDSIIDIAGAVFGFEWFDAARVVASPLNVGGGTVNTAHGLLPVPAPATAKLLEGIPVYSGGAMGELVTPTGALLVASFATEFGEMPPMRVDAVGYGAGDRDLPGMPNVVRVMVGESLDKRQGGDRVVVVECEIDDMNPQVYGVLMDRLYAAGALEVFYVPVQMKKGRPGTLVTVVAPPERLDATNVVLFRESTTIGVRYSEMTRACLAREIETVDTPVGAIRVKVARLGGEIVNAVPEFDDCVMAATERGLPVKRVQAIAVAAFEAQRRR